MPQHLIYSSGMSKSKDLTSAVQCGVPAAVSFVAKCNMVQHLQQCSAPDGFRPHSTQKAKYLFVFDLRVILFFLKTFGLDCKYMQSIWWHTTTSVTVTCHVSRVRLSSVSPDVLCSAPSVPQPVVQSRRRPLLGPSTG